MSKHLLVWLDERDVRHWLDADDGYCAAHMHYAPHSAGRFRHLENCEGFEHPGRTCDDAACDSQEAQ